MFDKLYIYNFFPTDIGESEVNLKRITGLKKMMFNADPRTQIIPSHLKQFIKSSLYNFNPKIKNAVTEEIKGIFNSENLPKLRLEARNLLNNNKTVFRAIHFSIYRLYLKISLFLNRNL